MPTQPAVLSVVVVAVSGPQSVQRTFAHLRRQTVRDQLEVVFVAPDEATMHETVAGVNDFAALRVIGVGPISARGAAAAAGVRASTAPLVGLLEDHSFPEPGWAAALIRAHEHSCVGAGPAVTNANPESGASYANFLLAYGAFGVRAPEGDRDLLPWHNSVYKREALAPFDVELGALLDWEGALQDALRARGGALRFAPQAVTAHANVSRWIAMLQLGYYRGRVLGVRLGTMRGWAPARRWLHAAAFPLFPIMQWRHLRNARQESPPQSRPRMRDVFATIGALGAMAVGEAMGLITGTGNALVKLEHFELRRSRFVTPRDRREVLGMTDAV